MEANDEDANAEIEIMDLVDNVDDGNSSSSSSSSGSSSDDSTESVMDVPQIIDRLENNDPDLTTFCMSNIGRLDDEAIDWRRIGLAIGRNTQLELLTFHHMNHNISLENYQALFEGVVQNNTNIRDIDFLQTDLLRGSVFPLLSPMFGRLHQLTIEDCELGQEGGLLLSQALDNSGGSSSSLEEINFDRIGTGEEAMIKIIKSLKDHSKLEKISLRANEIGTRGCIALLLVLSHHRKNNNSRLITLDLGENDILDQGAAILSAGLKKLNSSMTHLNIDSTAILSRGWRSFSNLILRSRSSLTSLSLNDNTIDDEAFIALASSLVNNSTLADLYLDHTDISLRGLQAFSTVLQSPQSGLKYLSLRSNRIKNKGAIVLANSLVHNNTLSQLNLENDITITSKGWSAFSRLLCRKSSIMDTYTSNHTLQKLVSDEWTLSGNLMLLLLMNRDGNRRRVARRKIIKCHFSGGNLDMQPFGGMKLGMLPHLISWMGCDGISLLYQFVRNMPSFFTFSDGNKARNGPATKRQKVHLQSVVHCPSSYIGEWWHGQHK